MNTIRAQFAAHATHPVVRAGTAVWNGLPTVLALNLAFGLTAAVPVFLVGAGHVLPALAAAVVPCGPVLGMMVSAGADVVAGRARPTWHRLPRAALRGVALSAPPAVAAAALLFALAMDDAGAAGIVRMAAIVADMLVLGTTLMVLPAASVEACLTTRPVLSCWRRAAFATGRRPFAALESAAAIGTVVTVWHWLPVVAVLALPMLVVLFLVFTWRE